MGSSAKSTAGREDERPRHGDALLLAAGELGRLVPEPVAEADGGDELVDPGLVALAPGDGQRQDDVLGRGQRRQQVERLEDEADLVAAQLREGAVLEARDLDAVDPDVAGARAGRGRRGCA